MRPRVFPAEDARSYVCVISTVSASMRPRVFPAEDCAILAATLRRRRFNEAAGIPRGRLTLTEMLNRLADRFNEAAGIPRGRHAFSASSRAGCHRSFNEAAGIPRGRPTCA